MATGDLQFGDLKTDQDVQRMIERAIGKPGVIPLNAVMGLAARIAAIERKLDALDVRVTALEP